MSDGITRRDATKLIAAAPAILSAAAGGEQIAFGLIGAGTWGQALLAYANQVRTGRCVAICDVDASNLRRASGISGTNPQTCSDYRALIERKDIQAVLVASPPHTHFPVTRDALLAGKHVQCEPPLACRPEEVHALRELASRCEHVVQVGLQRRYSKFYQTARQMVAKGFLGDITNIQAQWHRTSDRVMNHDLPKEKNWRYYRAYCGGPTAEMGSHQLDVAGWIFNDVPEFVSGVGSLDWKKDGRDVYDSAALIVRYPEGRQMTWSAITTNGHLSLFGGTRKESGETLIGTDGTIEITLGTVDQPAIGLWFYEPGTVKVSNAADSREIARTAGATTASTPSGVPRGMPILLERDQITGDESFLQRELKYARRWLYAKGLMLPEDDRPAVVAELESFFECCLSGRRPKADINSGLDNSATVILANIAMDEGRRVRFSEMEKLGRA